jgi:hypothetical protein
MKDNVGKILGYAAIAFVALIAISFLAGFLAWIWGKLVVGFIAALVIWLVQKVRDKPTDDGFIVYWGIGISALLIALDLVTMFIARFAWLIFIALIIGVIVWAYKKKFWPFIIKINVVLHFSGDYFLLRRIFCKQKTPLEKPTGFFLFF